MRMHESRTRQVAAGTDVHMHAGGRRAALAGVQMIRVAAPSAKSPRPGYLAAGARRVDGVPPTGQ
jgi:hypothetical protein